MDAAGWLQPPARVEGLSDVVVDVAYSSTCEKIAGNVLGPYETQKGSGWSDGPYVQ